MDAKIKIDTTLLFELIFSDKVDIFTLKTSSPPRVHVDLPRTGFSFDEPFNPYEDMSFIPNTSVLVPKNRSGDTMNNEKALPRNSSPEYYDSNSTLLEVNLPPRDAKFWMCIVALMLSSFLVVLDVSGLSTALPDIVNDLHGTEFEWIGSAYALASTAFLPLSGGLAQVFGRKPVLLSQVLLFAVGSAICGAASSMNILIAGRTIQGIGAGGISSLTQIIISDLVPLHERGTFNGLISLAYGLGSGFSPLLSGALAQAGQWRWFFYMNLPLAVITGFIIIVFLDVRAPKLPIKEKLLSLDWLGNFLVVVSTTQVVLALTWGFFIFEFYVPKTPLVPFEVLSSRTGISGYIQSFFGNFYLFSVIYYLPLYFQACKLSSPIKSGVEVLPTAFGILVFALIAGISIVKTGAYRPQLWLSWCFLMLSAGLMSTVGADTSTSNSIGFQVLMSVGHGILQGSPTFPILAPIDASLSANALAFFMFIRFFSQTWGITIGGAIVKNALDNKLPTEVIKSLPSGTSIVYSLVQAIPNLEEPLQSTLPLGSSQAYS
ncbi:MFS general substrate transporter [Pyrrhoderma noxium]|uniref:MFS general substrate transporter n=1 Tax=Pyrrhoderma noxium TaxID=2282107 RepID=A0A286UFW0_9AGAM|nr:MFS general substrate transporter [Pyrrhoderma noxium]